MEVAPRGDTRCRIADPQTGVGRHKGVVGGRRGRTYQRFVPPAVIGILALKAKYIIFDVESWIGRLPLKRKVIPVEELFTEWRRDLKYVREYDALEEEFALAGALIDARSSARLTQADVARRMRTSQQTVARLEGGRANPSVNTL